MGGTTYEFQDSDTEARVRSLGKKLLQTAKQQEIKKDVLLKLLRQASEHLEKVPQKPSKELDDIVSALGQKSVLSHKDKDVKLYVASCLVHVLRVYVPESPYTTAQLQDIFGLLLWVFRKLENASAPSFQRYVSILDTVSQTRCGVLALDFDGDDYTCDLFSVLLDVANEENLPTIEEPTLQLLGALLEESDEVPQRLLDIILGCLLAPKKDDSPFAYKLAQALIHRNEARLQPSLQRFLTAVMDGQPTESELHEDYHHLIYQVYRICPHALLPVLPHLENELQADEDAKRVAAVGLVGRLFSVPGSDMDAQYASLFSEFVRRFRDLKVEVRQKVLGLSAALLQSCSSADSRAQVLDALVDRLSDPEERVRVSAVAAICEAAAADLQVVTLEALEAVSERLRDVKRSVRREAATRLAAVFRAYCTRSHDGALVGSEEEAVLWVPGRLLLEASKSAELAHFLTESVLRGGLLPARLPPAAAARQWGAIYMAAEPQERAAVAAMLNVRAGLQALVAAFLAARAGRSAEPLAAQQRLNALARRLAAAFGPEAARAEAELLKLAELRDNHIFKGLAALAAPGVSLEDAAKTAKDVVQRVGSRGAIADVTRALCAKLAPTLLAPATAAALVDAALAAAREDGGPDFVRAALGLLADAAAAAPSLFSGLLGPVKELLHADEVELSAPGVKADLTLAATRVLAAAGAAMRAAAPEGFAAAAEELQADLLQLCRQGPPKAGKAAVRALVGLRGAEAAKVALAPLCMQLARGLAKPGATANPALPAALQALSSVGRLLPSVFAPHAEAVCAFVTQRLLVADDLAGCAAGSSRAGRDWDHFSAGIVAKTAAVKALARALVPDGPAAMRPAELPAATLRAVNALVPELASLLEVGSDDREETERLGTCGMADVGAVRLAAGAAMLRLARCHDARIPPLTFCVLALTMQDPQLEVRAAFGGRARRTVSVLLKAGAPQRAAKYAALLPLAAADPSADHRTAAYLALCEYVKKRRVAAAAAAASSSAAAGSGGTMLHELPDYLLPFLLQVMAHHPDFPAEEEVEEAGAQEAFAPFQKMLQFALEPLLQAGSSLPVPESPEAVLPVVAKVLRTLKHTEDATPEPATAQLHVLCDMALALAQALVAKHAPDTPPPGKVPGVVPLPTAFYRQAPNPVRLRDGSHLPPGLETELVELWPGHATPPRLGGRGRPAGRSKPRSKRSRRPVAAAEAGRPHKAARPAKQHEGEDEEDEASSEEGEEEEEEEEHAGAAAGGAAGGRTEEPSGAGPAEGGVVDAPGGTAARKRPSEAAAGAAPKRAKKSAVPDVPPAPTAASEPASSPRDQRAAARVQQRKVAAPAEASPAASPTTGHGKSLLADDDEDTETGGGGGASEPAAKGGGGGDAAASKLLTPSLRAYTPTETDASPSQGTRARAAAAKHAAPAKRGGGGTSKASKRARQAD
ncbi:hypothetical protein WJX81_007677 [Elliptochloris bilobata]|uniref:Sister chromatid cohesion protein n=1 Tax=Elliptochloris bilobata TaxID=381761 RepID=A0AAW1QHS1_9CHLO